MQQLLLVWDTINRLQPLSRRQRQCACHSTHRHVASVAREGFSTGACL